MKRTLLLLLFPLCALIKVQAHVVRWWDGGPGLPNSSLLRLVIYPGSTVLPLGFIEVAPGDRFEECTVTVKLDPLDPAIAEYVSLNILGANPDKSVGIIVGLKKIPPIALPFRIKGTWAATGKPDGGDCTAVFPNPFEVPVVMGVALPWVLQYVSLSNSLKIDTGGEKVGLQEACFPIGPWKTIAIGSSFSLNAPDRSDGRYYRGINRLGGSLVGTIYDLQGKPQTGVRIELPGGGASTGLDIFGNYQLPSLPYGDTDFHIWKPIQYLNPTSGLTLTQKVGITIGIPTKTAFTALQYWFDAQAFAAPKGDYSGWSAIGLARIDKSETYLYYDGGARPIADQPRNGSGAEVWITPPTGMPYKIGRGLDTENFIENPMPGSWKITTTLQNESRSLSLTVPLHF